MRLKCCNHNIPACYQHLFSLDSISQSSVVDIPIAVQYHIDQYYSELGPLYHSNPQFNAIFKICHLVSTLERIHPFLDGNCRTMLLVFYKLLFEQFQTFAILRDPNTFDGFSRAQLVNEVLDGISHFNTLLNPNVLCSKFDTTELKKQISISLKEEELRNNGLNT